MNKQLKEILDALEQLRDCTTWGTKADGLIKWIQGRVLDLDIKEDEKRR